MRRLLGAAGLFLLVGCGGAGQSLQGKEWNVEKDGVQTAIFGMVFDVDGNLVGTGLKSHHTYRYNVGKTMWEDLGALFDDGTTGIVQRDLEGNLYSYQDRITHNPSGVTYSDAGLYKLVDDKWTLTATFSPEMSHLYTFAPGGEIWSAIGNDDHTFAVYRKKAGGVGDWDKTLTATDSALGLKSSSINSISSDNVGNVYLNFVFGTRRVSATGDAVSRLYDCETQDAEYCNAAPHFDQYGQTLAIGGTSKMPGLYRVAPGETHPKFLAPFPEEHHVATGMLWDDSGNLYYTGSADYNGGAVMLYVMNAGTTEWTQVIEMPSIYFQLMVRGDGEVFAFDPADGTLVWLR